MKKVFLFFCLPLLLSASLLLCACSKEEDDGDAPEGCVRMENDALDYTFCYDEAWEVDHSNGMDGMVGIKYNVAGSSSIAYASISVMSFSLSDSGMGANNYWDSYREGLKDLYGDRITFESEKAECTLDGVPANRNLYTLQLSDASYTYEQVICVRYGTVYLVTLTAPEGSYEKTVDCLNTVIETFKFQ